MHTWYDNWIKYERGDMQPDRFLTVISDAVENELKLNKMDKTKYNIFNLLFPIELINSLQLGSIMERTIDYYIFLGTYLMRQHYPICDDDAWVAMQHVGSQNDFIVTECSAFTVMIQEQMVDEIKFHPIFFDNYHQLLLNTWLHKHTINQNMNETVFLVGI